MTDLRPYAVGAVAGAMLLALLPVSGLLNIAADPEQPDVTDLYFRLASRQSITLRSFDLPVPDLSDPARVVRAAGHYELVCADCHGSPDSTPARFSRDLSPQPPLLVEQMDHWRPETRIFTTVKHGIRRTAMPAWPSQIRDDEVWDMVAFLLALPDMDPVLYRALAGTAACEDCHGEAGTGGIAGIPRLDILTPDYIALSLLAFRDGTRQSGTMMAVARQLDDSDIDELARQLGRAVAPDSPAEPEGRGAEIARFGLPDLDIAACDSCHGPAADPRYPRLAGQDRDYLLAQLHLFDEHGPQRGGRNAHIMSTAIGYLAQSELGSRLGEEDIEALADHYAR